MKPQPGGAFSDGEPELLVEAPPDEGGNAQDRSAAAGHNADRCRRGEHGDDHRPGQHGLGSEPDIADQDRGDETVCRNDGEHPLLDPIDDRNLVA
ncbi:MAG TPA: hypothetical protein VMV08_06550 [Gaiellaceae bacterium]|nr:hypothetical protein [Gaiellaceae bacterium]